MRHLLTHTGGWYGDYFADPSRGDDALERILPELAELPQLAPLGQIWSYCNSGFYIAGRVIEVLTGRPFESAARELVLEPLGMSSSFFFSEEVLSHRFAVGHRDEDGQTIVARPWALARAASVAGGITSNVRDLLRYARFHLGQEPGPLTRESISSCGSRRSRPVIATWLSPGSSARWRASLSPSMTAARTARWRA